MADQPTMNGPFPEVDPEPLRREIPDDVLRRMNHAEWLRDFSKILGMRAPGSPPMTPMRQGAMQRLALAAQYIDLLKKDLWRAKHVGNDNDNEDRDDFTGR